ncbi:MAG: hypothetical protein E6J36_03735, partial [Chloroflexi bacterium]
MFDLVGKRYLFLLISLIVIIPGTISLLVKGLNVGIDFKGGATVELRPSTNITSAQMTRYLQPLKLENLEVLTGTNTTLKGPDVVWVRLNTQIDANVTDSIISTLQKQYGSQLTVQVSDLSIANQKISVLDITHFQGAPATPAQIKTVLARIPNTSDLSKASATPTVIPTTSVQQATATATNKPKATATVGKGTPTATATPT